MSRAKFNLWHAVIDRDQMGCSLDVTPAGHWRLADGAIDVVQDFLICAGSGGITKAWTITPFCSPFYSDFPDDERWWMRNLMGWRVHIEFQSRFHFPFVAFRAQPGHSDREDPTGVNVLEEEPWRFTRRRAVVIAAFEATSRDEAEARLRDGDLPQPSELLELVEDELYEARFDLGELEFPDGESKVTKLAEQCKAAGGFTHWRELASHDES